MTDTEKYEATKLMFEFMEYEGQCEEWCGCNRLTKVDWMDEQQLVIFNPDKDWNDLMAVLKNLQDYRVPENIQLKLPDSADYYKAILNNCLRSLKIIHIETTFECAFVCISTINKLNSNGESKTT